MAGCWIIYNVLLHFEHKNDVTIIFKRLNGATSPRRQNEFVAPQKLFTYLVFNLSRDIIQMVATYLPQLATRLDLSKYDVKIIFSVIFRT